MSESVWTNKDPTRRQPGKKALISKGIEKLSQFQDKQEEKVMTQVEQHPAKLSRLFSCVT